MNQSLRVVFSSSLARYVDKRMVIWVENFRSSFGNHGFGDSNQRRLVRPSLHHSGESEHISEKNQFRGALEANSSRRFELGDRKPDRAKTRRAPSRLL